jgi:hypothetical protein
LRNNEFFEEKEEEILEASKLVGPRVYAEETN